MASGSSNYDGQAKGAEDDMPSHPPCRQESLPSGEAGSPLKPFDQIMAEMYPQHAYFVQNNGEHVIYPIENHGTVVVESDDEDELEEMNFQQPNPSHGVMPMDTQHFGRPYGIPEGGTESWEEYRQRRYENGVQQRLAELKTKENSEMREAIASGRVSGYNLHPRLQARQDLLKQGTETPPQAKQQGQDKEPMSEQFTELSAGFQKIQASPISPDKSGNGLAGRLERMDLE